MTTAIAIHLPSQLELSHDESFSTQDDTKKVVHQFLEFELEEEEESPEFNNDQTNLNNNNNNNTKNRTVHFSLAPPKIHDTIHRKDMTTDEKEATWMTINDIMATKKEMLYTRELMNQFLFQGDNLEYTCRGLELRFRKLIRNCQSIVLQEQYRQSFAKSTTTTNDNNQVLIASRYALGNRKAMLVAVARANKDRLDVLTKMYSPEQLAKEEEEGYGFYNSAFGGTGNDDNNAGDDDESSVSSDENCSQEQKDE